MDNAAILAELARVKAVFQLRAIRTVMGIPDTAITPPQPQNDAFEDGAGVSHSGDIA